MVKKSLEGFDGKEIHDTGSGVFCAHVQESEAFETKIFWKKTDFSKLETESPIKGEVIALQDALIS